MPCSRLRHPSSFLTKFDGYFYPYELVHSSVLSLFSSRVMSLSSHDIMSLSSHDKPYTKVAARARAGAAPPKKKQNRRATRGGRRRARDERQRALGAARAEGTDMIDLSEGCTKIEVGSSS